MKPLAVVPMFVGPRHNLLPDLMHKLARTFDLDPYVQHPWFDPEHAYDVSRGQYHSTLLLKALLHNAPERAVRIVGITSVDLFIPVLTYVFGEAQLDGRAAMVSFRRLQNELYGLAPDEALLRARLDKETIHELGHTYGLIHCREASCVMHASTYAEDIDLKTDEFCPDCRAALRKKQPGEEERG